MIRYEQSRTTGRTTAPKVGPRPKVEVVDVGLRGVSKLIHDLEVQGVSIDVLTRLAKGELAVVTKEEKARLDRRAAYNRSYMKSRRGKNGEASGPT